jgi:glycerophosphoryl diester phosphodiesterase
MSLDFPRVIAHRGAPQLCPENTLASLHQAIELGAKMVEVDVQVTTDGVVFVLHDVKLPRTTNGSGVAERLTFSALQKLDAGTWFSPDFAFEKIPALSDWLAKANQYAVNLNIELKGKRHYKELVIKTLELVEQHFSSAGLVPLYSSASWRTIRYLRSVSAQAQFALVLDLWPYFFPAIAKDPRCVSLNFNYRVLNERRVAKIHRMGKKVLAYTVNDMDEAKRLFAMGVDTIFSDNMDLIAAFS